MSRVPASVVVIATMDNDVPVGMVVGTFTSVSLSPLLVGFLGERRSSTLPRLLNADAVSCNVLHDAQLHIVDAFRRSIDERFDGLDWHIDQRFQVPVLVGATLVVFGKPTSTTDAGDHVFAMIDVNGLQATGPARPLVFCGGRLTRMDPGRLVDGDMWQLGYGGRS
jgi:flavin reductase (DIM6/NTAB) family NADH-FMN oxidoreductase RutF